MICLASRRSRMPFDRRYYRLLIEFHFHGAEHIQYPCRFTDPLITAKYLCRLPVIMHDNCVTYALGVNLQKSTRDGKGRADQPAAQLLALYLFWEK